MLVELAAKVKVILSFMGEASFMRKTRPPAQGNGSAWGAHKESRGNRMEKVRGEAMIGGEGRGASMREKGKKWTVIDGGIIRTGDKKDDSIEVGDRNGRVCSRPEIVSK